MNNWLSIFLSYFTSPVVTLLMIGVLLLHIPVARRQSKHHGTVFLFLAGALTLVLLPGLFFRSFTVISGEPAGIILATITLILVILSSCFLVIFHILLKNNILDLEDKFLKVFNTSPHGMMIVKVSDAMIKEVNSAFSRVSGYSAEEVVGKTTLGLGLWHDPEQRKDVVSVLMNYESFGPVEYKFIPKTGVPTKFLFTAQFIFIKGEKYLVAHIEEKHDTAASGNETKNLLKQRLREIMSQEALYKTSGLTLSDLAEKLETNKTYLSQAINSEYGNFNEYLNRFRVIEACRLIQDGLDPRYSIDHLYSKVGFSSRTTFYIAFKRFTGVSPSRFRQINDLEKSKSHQ
jgi:PAS domain S-box-containing protein